MKFVLEQVRYQLFPGDSEDWKLTLPNQTLSADEDVKEQVRTYISRAIGLVIEPIRNQLHLAISEKLSDTIQVVSPEHDANTTAELDRLTYTVYNGDAGAAVGSIQVLVNCVVTSPPYYQKRQYGDSGEELGHERSVEAYIQNLVSIFNAIPLHPLGSVWVNLGDSRASNGGLLRVPDRFCNAMCQSGWTLVDEVIWAKVLTDDNGSTEGGCMPEPAPGRLNGNGFEMMYRFTKPPKGMKAWADTCAVRLPRHGVTDIRYLPPELMQTTTSIEGRNLPNVWRIPMGQTSEKHYAVFPPALVERPIAMTCPMWVNPDGSFRSRIVEMAEYDEQRGGRSCQMGKYTSITSAADVQQSGRNDSGRSYIPRKPVTKGWTDLDNAWRPGVVLDPFAGTGTTCEVALRMGRSVIAVELYEKNCAMIKTRCQETFDHMREQGLNPFRRFQ